MDLNIFKCTQIQEINECGIVDDTTILLCNDKEIHRFSCTDKSNRDKWIKKVNKLVDKRRARLQSINNHEFEWKWVQEFENPLVMISSSWKILMKQWSQEIIHQHQLLELP